MRCRNDVRMIREPQVVVGAKIQDVVCAAVILHINCRLLGAGDQAFGLLEAFGFKGLSLFCEGVEKTAGHGVKSLYSKGAKYSKMRFFRLMVLAHAI